MGPFLRAAALALPFAIVASLAHCDPFGGDEAPVAPEPDSGPVVKPSDAGVEAAAPARPKLVQSRAVFIEESASFEAKLGAPVTAGNLLVVAISNEFPKKGAVTKVSDDLGNVYASADVKATAEGCNGGITSEIHFARNVKGGDPIVHVETSESTDLIIWLLEASGVSQLEKGGATNGEVDATLQLAAPAVTTTAASSLVVSVACACEDVKDLLAPGFTELEKLEGEGAAWLVTSGPGTYGAQWTAGEGPFNASTVAFKP